MDQTPLPDTADSFLPTNMGLPERLLTESPSNSALQNMNDFSNTPLDDFLNSEDDRINAMFASSAFPASKPTAFDTHNKRQPVEFDRRVQSDAGTVPDSGYGTLSAGAWQSVGNPSVCEDSAESRSNHNGYPPLQSSLIQTSGQLPETTGQWQKANTGPNLPRVSMPLDGDAMRDVDVMRYGASVASGNAYTLPTTAKTAEGTESSRSSGHGAEFICEKCGHIARTASEFTKHRNRHIRPYKCTVANCKWEKGFATINDRDRHMRNVHRDDVAVQADYYRCPIEKCKKKDKKWHRLDNFRHHLSHVHKVAKGDIQGYCIIHKPQQHNDLAGLSPAPAVAASSLADAMSIGARFSTPLPQTWPMEITYLNVMACLQNRGVGNTEELQNYVTGFSCSQPLQGPCNAFLDSPNAEEITGSALSLHNSPRQMLLNLGQDSSHAASILASLAGVSDVATRGTTAMEPPASTRRRNPLPSSRGFTQTSGQSSNPGPVTSSSLASLAAPLPRDGGRVLSQQGFARTVTPSVSQASTQDIAMSDARSVAGENYSVADNVLDDSQMVVDTTENAADEDDDEDEDGECDDEKGGDSNEDEGGIGADSHSNGYKNKETALRVSGPVTVPPETEPRELVWWKLTKEKVADIIKELRKAEGFDTVMADLGFQKVESRELVPKIAPSEAGQSENSARNDVKSQDNVCHRTACGRRFLTKSGLRKHMMRHSKPYSCTFPDCTGRFGSKDDWKRHEDSQHIYVESWRCSQRNAVDGGTQVICGKKFDSGEEFRSHLEKAHGVKDLEVLGTLVATQRFGTGYRPHFWCGFCKRDIQVVPRTHKDAVAGRCLEGTGACADKDSQASSNDSDIITSKEVFRQRSDHIDDHFMGRLPGKDIAHWDREGHPNLYKTFIDTEPLSDDAEDEVVVVGSRPVSSSLRKRKRDKRSPTHGQADAGQDDQDGENDKSSAKRTKGRIYMWTCCGCAGGPCRLDLHSLCIECEHRRCDNCDVYGLSTRIEQASE